ncbi:MAG TPA: hypothetical protein VN328_12650 [Thermodesulfovibrionales bacterium]|nr:hypothetical protein [Thermodesulfovibrionales bacterium]
MENSRELQSLQGLMIFLGSLANGLDEVLGKGAASITNRAGRATGLKTPVKQTEREDVLKALGLVREAMYDIGIHWDFEPYKKKGQAELFVKEDAGTKVQLVFRNCMIRSSLFRYGYPQKLSLCVMNHGLFCGFFEQIYGVKANIEIIHAGENACLKTLTIGA